MSASDYRESEIMMEQRVCGRGVKEVLCTCKGVGRFCAALWEGEEIFWLAARYCCLIGRLLDVFEMN